MPNLLDDLRARLTGRPKGLTLAAAEADLATATEAHNAAQRRLEDLRGARDSKLLASDADFSTWRAEVADATDQAERAEALLRAAGEVHAAALRADTEARRKAAYERAIGLQKAARRALRERYPTAAEVLVSILRQTTEADVAAAEVNADLPDGAAPISAVEAIRDQPGLPRQEISTTEESRWIYAQSQNPIAEHLKVVTRDGVTGTVTYARAGNSGVIETHQVILQTTVITTYHPPEPVTFGPRLAELELPGLKVGEAAFWAGARDMDRPKDLLARLDQPKPAPRRNDGPREIRTERRLQPLPSISPSMATTDTANAA